MLIERQRHYYKSVSDDAEKSVSVIAKKLHLDYCRPKSCNNPEKHLKAVAYEKNS